MSDEPKTPAKKAESDAKKAPTSVGDAPKKDAPKTDATKKDTPKTDAQSSNKPSNEPSKKRGADLYRIAPSHPWFKLWMGLYGVGAVCLAAAFAMSRGTEGEVPGATRFAYSYLFAFQVAVTLALGSLFFVLMQRLTSAGWSVTVRRTSEFLAAGAVVFIVLVVPVYLNRGVLYPWLHQGEHSAPESAGTPAPEHSELQKPGAAVLTAADLLPPKDDGKLAQNAPHGPRGPEDGPAMQGPPHGGRHNPSGGQHAMGVENQGVGEHGRATESRLEKNGDPEEVAEVALLKSKSGFLNEGFFTGRMIFYVLAWSMLGLAFLGWSTKQDTTKDPGLTVTAQKWAPLSTILFGLTLTFAGFDWIMSLYPSWFSTIFGVYIFSGCATAGLALLIVVTLAMRNAGLLKNEVNVEHYHDIGKLMFGFNCFWAYIGFAQFMLIWYASIPEETTFFHLRWWDHGGPWWNVSVFLVIGHFVVPFIFLMSRNIKRRLGLLAGGSLWILAMHVLDVYWLVLPNLRPGGKPLLDVSILDGLCLVGVLGIYFGESFRRMTLHSLIPIGDPRLPRAIHFENA